MSWIRNENSPVCSCASWLGMDGVEASPEFFFVKKTVLEGKHTENRKLLQGELGSLQPEAMDNSQFMDQSWSPMGSKGRPLHYTPAKNARKVILLLTVEIEEDRFDTIIVHENDSCEDLAIEFQMKHNLASEVIAPLTDYIRSNVEGSKKPAQKKRNRSMSIYTSYSSQKKKSTESTNSSYYHNVSCLSKSFESLPKPNTKKKNERILEKNTYSKRPVFDRLHECARHKEAKVLKIKAEMERNEKQKIECTKIPMSINSKRIAEEMDRTRVATQKFNNYGEYLYDEAKFIKEKHQETVKRLELLNEAKLDMEATFHPKINHNYKSYVNLKRNLMERVMEKSLKRPKPLFEYQQLESNLTFKPKINKESKKIVDEKKARKSNELHSDSPHENLFKEAEERRKKLQKNMQLPPTGTTFKPDIGRNSLKRMETDKEEFINRLMNSKKESEKHVAQLRLKLYSHIDQETGRELFKPYITNYPISRIQRKKAWQ